MSATVLYMSISVDGFIAGPNVRPDNGFGDGGERLHEWVFGKRVSMDPEPRSDVWFGEGGVNDTGTVGRHLSGPDREVWTELMATGAVLAGRGTIEPAGGWGGDHHAGVPIFILSRHAAPPEFADYPLIHYVSDLEKAVHDAKAAARGRNVLVHGAGLAQRLLRAGLLDEIQLHLVPVLFGQGVRLFDALPAEQIELQLIREIGGAEVVHLRYRVTPTGASN